MSVEEYAEALRKKANELSALAAQAPKDVCVEFNVIEHHEIGRAAPIPLLDVKVFKEI